MTRDSILNIPNALSTLRLVLVALLWPAALAGKPVLVAIGIAIAGVTDVADGIIARASGQRTRLGSQLDSIADLALMGSTFAWLLMLRPTFFHENRTLLLTWAILGAITLVIGWLRFRRLADLHLYSAKTAGAVAYVFAIYLLLTGHYERWAFYIVFGIATAAVLEALLVFATGRGVEPKERRGCMLTLLTGVDESRVNNNS